MAPFLLQLLVLTPFRNAAMIPITLLTAITAGACYGSFDLSRKTATIFFPLRTSTSGVRRGSPALCSVAALTVSCGIVALRETFFAPPIVPSPNLPIESGPALQRIRNASKLFGVSTDMISFLSTVWRRCSK